MKTCRPGTSFRASVAVALSALVLSEHGGALLAQGRTDYFNVESPQVSPIAFASVNGKNVLVVCNTPDNSIELWDTDESIAPAARFIQRLWVGLEPVSVTVDPATGEFFTANFLGDSVTRGIVEADGSSVRARLLATTNVGDEPMDIAFHDSAGIRTIFVTLNTSSALAWLLADDLTPRVANVAYHSLVEGGSNHGLKEPRAVRVDGGRVYALAFKGGVTDPLSRHDMDVLSAPIATPLSFDRAVPPSLGSRDSLGSTNANMRFASNGDLYVVGGEAQNFNNEDKIALRNLPTGFVTSMLYRVPNPSSASPTVFRRDLNLTASGAVVSAAVPGSGAPASQPTDLALLESGGAVTKVYVAAFSSDRIVVFGPSGSVAANPDVATWKRTTIALGATVGGNPRFGPRGLVLANGTSGQRLYVLCRLDNSVVTINPANDTVVDAFALRHDPTPSYIRDGRPFLYSADLSGSGHVSCSSCHPDGRTDGLSWKLGNPNGIGPFEPAPTVDFLVGLAGTGTNGGVLSDPDFHIKMVAGQTFTAEPPFGDKREMVTQSLQGLLNFEVEPDGMPLVTNAPYHWRGDKPSFVDFNEAFVALMNGANIGTTADAKGLTAAEMEAYEEFINSINYPPNPQQPLDRDLSQDDAATGFAGGAQGQQLFYERPNPILANRSCSQCHDGSEGSNQRLSVFAPDPVEPGYVSQLNRQPIESAAMRGLLQKEPLLEASAAGPLPYVAQPPGAPHPNGFYWNVGNLTSPGSPTIGHFGLNHTGIQRLIFIAGGGLLTSLNTFVDLFFPNAAASVEARAVKQYCHEFDWGVAPIVGLVTVLSQDVIADPGRFSTALGQLVRMVAQAHAGNASVVAWLNKPNDPDPTKRTRGFRYLPHAPSGGGFGSWIEEPTWVVSPFGSLSPMITSPADTLTLHAVPLGSERRIAFHDPTVAPNPPLPASPPVPVTVQPTSITLLPMQPDTAHTAIPGFVDNWAPLGAPGIAPGAVPFDFNPPDSLLVPGNLVDDVYSKTLRIYQYGLIDGQNGGTNYGVSTLRHEAPRRLRVAGAAIMTGAVLRLQIPNPPAGYGGGSIPGNPHPLQSSLNETAGSGPIIPLLSVDLPIHPTNQTVSGSGLQIWETAVEVDPLIAYQLMLGWTGAPGVAETVTEVIFSEYLNNPTLIVEPTSGTPPFPLPFAPNEWNWHRIEVVNPAPAGGTTSSAATWQQLKM